jgi:hypothetical protein
VVTSKDAISCADQICIALPSARDLFVLSCYENSGDTPGRNFFVLLPASLQSPRILEVWTMRHILRLGIVATTWGGVIGSAWAAELSGADIKTFLSDKTAYLDASEASAAGQAGQVIIYWAANGTALYKTPAGALMHGTWVVKGDTNCTEWKERPNTGCVRYDKAGDIVSVIDVASGKVRAKITKTAPGNVEKLGP